MRALLFTAVLLLLAGGGVWAARSAESGLRLPGAQAKEPARSESERERPRSRSRSERAPSPLPPSECPEGLANCRSVEGRVLYVESVDPDGDGDLHVVLAGGGVSGPGITAVDVKPALRPKRDPRPGDRVSAAGQVQPGSYGQRQIHAEEFHLRRG